MKILSIFIILIISIFVVNNFKPLIKRESTSVIIPLPTISVKEVKTMKVLVTYFYTPIIVVLDYGVNPTMVNYKGKDIPLFFPDGAVNVIAREGFAILKCNTETLQGTFIVDNKLNVQPFIKGSRENHLKVGMIASDTTLIPYGKKIKLNDIVYTSGDIGSKIKGPHVDVYMGALPYKEAETLSRKLGGYKQIQILN